MTLGENEDQLVSYLHRELVMRMFTVFLLVH